MQKNDRIMEDRKIHIMGIVNLTDDSYYAESRCLGRDGKPDISRTLGRIGTMLSEGADIIDLGACSTRPGSEGIGADEEWRRLSPVLDAVRKEYPDARISVDTYWSSVVRKTYGLIGDFIVNDISAGEDDPLMLPAVAELGLTYIAMHKRGNPRSMDALCDYPEGVVAAVQDYFAAFAARAERCGVRRWILDPGLGFAKTAAQNWELLSHLGEFGRFGRPILIGAADKRFTAGDTEKAHRLALANGAGILRVHDVAQAVEAVKIVGAITGEYRY